MRLRVAITGLVIVAVLTAAFVMPASAARSDKTVRVAVPEAGISIAYPASWQNTTKERQFDDDQWRRENPDIADSLDPLQFSAKNPRGRIGALQMTFNAGANAPISLTGLLAPFESKPRVLRDFQLTSWRYLGNTTEKLAPRGLRKLKIARGLMVYEGLR